MEHRKINIHIFIFTSWGDGGCLVLYDDDVTMYFSMSLFLFFYCQGIFCYCYLLETFSHEYHYYVWLVGNTCDITIKTNPHPGI